MDFFWMILIGMIAGWLAGQVMTRRGFGVIGDIVTGMVGALIGGVVFQEAGILPGSGLIGSLIVATTGAVVFLYGLRLIKRV